MRPFLPAIALFISPFGSHAQTTERTIAKISAATVRSSVTVKASDAGSVILDAQDGVLFARAAASADDVEFWVQGSRRLVDSTVTVADPRDVIKLRSDLLGGRAGILLRRDVSRGGSEYTLIVGVSPRIVLIPLPRRTLDSFFAALRTAVVDTRSMAGARSTSPPAVPSRDQAPVAPSPQETFYEFQVEVPVRPLPDQPAPEYPESLRQAGFEGAVLGSFVVDTLGIAVDSTFKVISSAHEAFTTAVRELLPHLRFSPAELRGRKVQQLVQMPFRFKLGSEPR